MAAITMLKAFSSTIPRTSTINICHVPGFRNFAKAATVQSTGYIQAKNDAKNRRRETYLASLERQERLKTRRNGAKGVGEKRRSFRKYFIPKKVDEEYMNRKARQAGLGWNHKVAVILTRTSTVLPDEEEWEVEYDNLRTHLNRFGIDHPAPFGNNPDPGTVALTNEELLELLPEGFTPAPRETEADETGNVRTTDRKLKTDIHLLFQNDGKWEFPTVELNEDETLLEAAKRALAIQAGSEVKYWTISNAPCAVNLDALPEAERKDVYGTKTFFMKINYDEGQINESSTTLDDYAWLDSKEILELVKERDEDSKLYQYLL